MTNLSLVPSLLLLLIASHGFADERQDCLDALGMALPDSSGRDLVFYDRGGSRLVIEEMDYRRSLAQEPLVPDEIRIRAVTIRTGQHEAALQRKLGSEFRVVADTHEQSRDSSIAYFREIILRCPNTLRYYACSELQGLEGWFRVLEWEVADSASVRAYFHSPERQGPFVAKLLELELPEIEVDSVSYVSGAPLTLDRRGAPRVTWDLGQNVVSIGEDDR